MRFWVHIPNFMSLLNLLCGVLAIVCVFEFELHYASWFIIAGALLDFFDGLVARLLNAHSELGKYLDSLADVVTFGVAPGIIGYQILASSHGLEWFTFIPLMIPMFGALRLARFNAATNQDDSFIGMPIPANALFWLSLPLILHFQDTFRPIFIQPQWISHPTFIVLFTALFSLLMVSNLPMLALKFKDLSWSNNHYRYVFLVLSILTAIFFFFEAMPIILLLYVVISLIQTIGKK